MWSTCILLNHLLEIFMGFLGGLVLKNLAANARDTRDKGLIPGWERSPGGGNGNPRQYSYLGSPMDRGAWWATVHGVTKSWTQLRDWACGACAHTHTHTRSCASLYSPSSKWFHDALCVAQQKKGTRNGCYLYNWHWQQLSHRTERTCENHHHSFATVSAISTQAPEHDNGTRSVSRCNVDKSASQLLTLLMLMRFFKDWI